MGEKTNVKPEKARSSQGSLSYKRSEVFVFPIVESQFWLMRPLFRSLMMMKPVLSIRTSTNKGAQKDSPLPGKRIIQTMTASSVSRKTNGNKTKPNTQRKQAKHLEPQLLLRSLHFSLDPSSSPHSKSLEELPTS